MFRTVLLFPQFAGNYIISLGFVHIDFEGKASLPLKCKSTNQVIVDTSLKSDDGNLVTGQNKNGGAGAGAGGGVRAGGSSFPNCCPLFIASLLIYNDKPNQGNFNPAVQTG